MLHLIDNHLDYASLPAEVQSDVSARLDWVRQIIAAGHGRKGALVKSAEASLNCDESTIHRYLRNFRQRGWAGLVDGRCTVVSHRALPQAFRDFVAMLHLQNQRSTTGLEVQRQLIERVTKWRRTGDPALAIPGYPTPPPNERQGYPRGWSIDNIYRMRPDTYALATVRQGAKSAADFLPSILKTRAGLKFGQVVFFDDQDYDLKVVAPGTSQKSLRPQGFNSLDYLSGCFLDYHIRLRWWDTAADQYRTLTQQEFTWFVLAHLQRHGYRANEGTTLVFEHGTATGFNNKDLLTFGGHCSFDAALAAVSNGKITVNRSGLFNSPSFAGMLFRPQSSGNPNFKAPLESMFNLVRNRFAALPGATGLDRDMKPAEQYGQDLYVAQLCKVWERLDESHRELLRFPIMTASQFGNAAAAVYQAINSRVDHHLQGWHECGFVVPQIRFAPDDRAPWMSQQEIAKLPEKSRELALALAEVPGHVRPLALPPAAVAAAGARELTQLGDHLIPLLIPRQWARTATVKSDRTISLSDQMLGPEAMRYVCRFETRDGAHTLKPGMEILCYLNPFNPERLAITRTDGSYLGTLTQMGRAAFTDHAAIVGQLEERAKLKADLDAGVRPHLEGEMARRQADKRHNDRLANGQPVTPEELADARSEAGRQGHRTAAANRLQGRGDSFDADSYQPPSATDAFDSLPDDTDIPEGF